MGNKATPIQTNFNGGLFSSHLQGRTDVEKYFTSTSEMTNFIPLVQGPAVRRPGRRFVAPAMGPSRLIEFQLNPQQAYVLEFSNDGRLRFFTTQGQILAGYAYLTAPATLVPGTPTSLSLTTTANMRTSGHLSIGQSIDCTYTGSNNGTPGTLTGVTLGTPNVSSFSTTTTFPSGTIVTWPYELATPFNYNDDLWQIKHAQSNDVMYIVHPNHPPMKLNRLADNNWIINYPAFRPPPMTEVPVDVSLNTGLTISGNTASAGAVFLPGDVGKALVAGIGLAYISQVVSSSVVNLQTVDSFNQGYYPPGQWFLKGAPNSYFCLGVEDTSSGKKIWKSSRQLGAGAIQTAFTFAKFPQEDIAPPPVTNSFRSSDLGRYITGGGAVMQIVGVLSPSEVSVLMLSPVTDTYTDTNGVIRATPQSGGDWNMEDPTYTAARGYPTVVAFFQDRLWLASSATEPQTLYASVTSDYENFAKGAQDTDALQLTINNGRQDHAQWMAAFQGLLITGTLNGEYAVGAGQAVVGGNGPAITPTNATSMIQSSYGSWDVQPILVESQMLYVQRARFNVYEMAFSIYSSVLASTDLNIFATLDTTAGVREIKYQQFPWRTIWLTTIDGQMWGLTYKKDEQIAGWHTHITGYDVGTSLPTGTDGIAGIAVIPDTNAQRDVLFLASGLAATGCWNIVIDDHTLSTDYASSAVFNSPVSQIGGFNYLTSMAVDVKVDGAYQGSKVVDTNGNIPIRPAGRNIEVGVPFASTLLTNRLAERGGAQVQGLLKKWNTLWVRVNNTLGVKVNGSRVIFRRSSDDMDGPVPPFTGDIEAKSMPGNNRESQILVEQDQPFYCEVQAIFGQVNIGEI